MMQLFRLVSIIATSSFFGSWLAQEPQNQANQVGFAGWWSAQPTITKVVAYIAVGTGALALYNYFRHGSIKGVKR